MKRSRVEFGADGIRGIAGRHPFIEAAIPAIGKAFALFARNYGPQPTVIIGRDTRPSGRWIAHSLIDGLSTQGIHAIDLGVMTTPGVAYLLRRQQADMGLIVSASHSPAEYNGIKVLGPRGLRLDREAEMEVEALIARCLAAEPTPAPEPGQITDGNHLIKLYVYEHARLDCGLLPPAATPFAGLSVLLDCADGAASVVAPRLFTRLGASVSVLNAAVDGSGINHECGSEHARKAPAALADAALRQGASYAFAFDGDGDRLTVVDAQGRAYDGNDLLYALARVFAGRGRLTTRTVVTSRLANGGLEPALARHGIDVLFVNKGDRNIEQAMWSKGHFLGGEEGGNIILNDGLHTAADAVYTAMLVCAVLLADGLSLRELTAGLVKHPRVLRSFRLDFSRELFERMWPLLEQAHLALGADGRAEMWDASTELGKTRILVEGGPAATLEDVERAAFPLSSSLQFLERGSPRRTEGR